MMEILQTIADYLHTLMCNEPHCDDVMAYANGECDGCPWYLEELITDCWDREAHKKWLGQAIDILKLLDKESPQDALTTFLKIMEVFRAFCGLSQQEQFVLRMLINASLKNLTQNKEA